jgi:hypothetical protein
MTISPGSLVSVVDRPSTPYEVVNVDDFAECVWVRRWPLADRRAAAFVVPIGHVRPLPPEMWR